MLVVILIAIVAVLAGVFVAATGRGGELASEHADHAPLDLGPVTAPDIALLRPPTAMWGYNMQVTDEALDQIARAMRDRDVTIAYLQEQLANRDADPAAAAQDRRPADALGTLEAVRAAGNPEPSPLPRRLKAPGVLVAPLPPKVAEPSEATQPSGAVTQPPETLPTSYDAQSLPGPQGSYDTHGWWAQQEEAAREEEARPQDAAQEAREGSAVEAGAPAARPVPPDDDSPGAAEEQSR